MTTDGCVFCRIAAGEMGKAVWQDDQVVAFHQDVERVPLALRFDESGARRAGQVADVAFFAFEQVDLV